MAEIKNLDILINKLQQKIAAAIKDANFSVVVGNTSKYAVFVHENMSSYHEVGQAKFLEQPAREHAGELAAIVRKAMKAGMTLAQACLMAGLKLQREAQLLTPVDTGMLKNSFFTRLEDVPNEQPHGPIRPIENDA